VTLGQFFLGLVTIFVATFVYRWQKTLDLENQTHHELRKLFSEYSSLLKTLYFRQPYKDADNDPAEVDDFFSISIDEQKCYSLRDQIYMLAAIDVVEATTRADKAFREWKISFPKSFEASDEQILDHEQKRTEFRNAHNSLIMVMRSDIAQSSSTDLRDVFRKMFASRFG